MYLTDLAFIEEGTPNFTEEGLVNFSKMRMVKIFPELPVSSKHNNINGIKMTGLSFSKKGPRSRLSQVSIRPCQQILITGIHAAL